MDAITLLKDQHRDVEKLFKQFEQAGDNARVRKRDLVDKIIENLSKHAAIEEQLFYPVTRKTVPVVEGEARESLEEHHIVKWVLADLEKMDPADEQFDAKVTVLIENVRHHVEDEESDYFPKVRDELGRKELGELGDAMEQMLPMAPTHPHPRAAQTPPRNLIEGTVAGVVDRVVDTVNGVAQGTYDAVADVIAGARGQTRSSRLSGGPTTRRAARRTKGNIESVRDQLVEQVREAKAAGEDTTDRVRRTAETTARTTRTGAVETAKAATAATKGTITAAQGAVDATSTAVRDAARETARAVGDASDDVTDAVQDAAGRTRSTAKRGATTTRRTARSSAKRVSTQAKRQANTSKSASKRGGRSKATSKA